MNPLNLVCMTRRDRCHWIAGLNIRIVRMWSFPVNTGVRRVSLSLWLPQSANIHIQWTSDGLAGSQLDKYKAKHHWK